MRPRTLVAVVPWLLLAACAEAPTSPPDAPRGGATTAPDATAPDPAAPGAGATELVPATVVSGGGDSCALARSGTAYCWGENSSGQLGVPVVSCYPNKFCSTVPVAVRGSLTWTALTAGSEHTCSLTSDGDVYCWGDNRLGQLGAPSADTCVGWQSCSRTPVRVSTDVRFASLALGGLHSCGIAEAPAPGAGHVYCWGLNVYSQLGVEGQTNRTDPTPVRGGITFAAISAGAHHNCAVTADGRGYCWGAGQDGRLGNGAYHALAVGPEPIAGGGPWTRLSAGGSHSCGVSAGGVYCWGYSHSGQAGTGAINRTYAEPVPIAALTP